MNVTYLTLDKTWAIAAAAFTNPMYLSAPLGATDNGASTGFDISLGSTVVVSFEGTYTGQAVTHEQTQDPNGEDGWFSVEGAASDGSASSASGSTADVAYVFPTLGNRHRVRVSALATGTLECRVSLNGAVLNSTSSSGGGSATAANQALEIVELEAINTKLATPAASLPPVIPVASSNAVFTRGTINLAAVSGDQTIVTATAAVSTRIHGLFVTFSGAVSETLVTVKSGATSIGFFRVPATPNVLVIDRRDLEQWLYKTADNEAFILSPAAAVNIAGDTLYVKGA